MVIVLDTQFKKGDVVTHICDDEYRAVVQSYHVYIVDDSGTVLSYSVGCSAPNGEMRFFYPNEIKKVDITV